MHSDLRHRSAILSCTTALAFKKKQLDNFSAQPGSIQHQYPQQIGPQISLEVNQAKQSFPLEFVRQAHDSFDAIHYQMGGDHALYYNKRLNEFLPSAMIEPAQGCQPLPLNIHPELPGICQSVPGLGELSLKAYVEHPAFRVQGVMMLHRGRVVYQAYPGMNPQDTHVWMSNAKSTVGLVLAQLICEGKVELDLPVSFYVQSLRGSNWDLVSVRHALNMATALDIEENHQSRMDPNSMIARFFSAEMGQPEPITQKVEHSRQLVRQASYFADERAGTTYRYSSIATAVLVSLAEQVESQCWSELFGRRIWGQLKAEHPMQIALDPDGTALVHGLALSTLADAARFALLFTPSWSSVANNPVVTDEMLQLIRLEGNPVSSFSQGERAQRFLREFAGEQVTNSFHFDAVFEDGALYSFGLLGQGMYIDPERDFVAVYFSSKPEQAPFGDDLMLGYLRPIARQLNQEIRK